MSESELKDKIEKLEARIKELEKDLIHDSLTTLKTRAFFETETKTYLGSLQEDKNRRLNWFSFRNLSVLFFDIDHFKKINDSYGHNIGDLVLKKVAETINKNVRDGDIVARYGGEEMVASLLGAREKDAVKIAEKIRKNIESLTFPDASDLKVTISIGISTYSKDNTYNDLLKNADLALYRAKRDGRNKVVAFSEL